MREHGVVALAQRPLWMGLRKLPRQRADLCVPDVVGRELRAGEPLPAGGGALAVARSDAARVLAQSLQLQIAPAVDFWTQAALFSAAGLTALVYGPGDIAQAHSADEWVRLSELAEAAQTYRRIIDGARA